eukprot:TRINITY_DN8758_c0_g1_i1.p1 TRINITY_DN8758_c0_g1~~TRINITY_DN8758_c0_g1_i1.p1  ORF type:complete len:479 (+),score=110.00 TRINITY_DN8758_c0_g1_i1:125-1438(+)
MVGASIACGLRQSGLSEHLRIGIIDSVAPQPLHPLPSLPDLRVFAVNQGAIQFFKAIDVWDIMKGARVAPFYDMKVWDSKGPGKIEFSHDQHGEPLGHIIEHHVIQASIYQKLTEIGDVDFIFPETVQNITFDQDLPLKIETKSRGTFQANLVIGADGANSIVKKLAGISSIGYPYNQKAVVATIKMKNPNFTAWQRFLPTGPVAILPLEGNYSSIVWSTNALHAEQLLSLPEDSFVRALREAFTESYAAPTPSLDGGILGDVGGAIRGVLQQVNETIHILAQKKDEPFVVPEIEGLIGKRAAFPLRIGQATSYVKPRLALTGDAAHLVHPFAGQGLNLGLGDAVSLINSILEAIQCGSDIGNIVFLQKYESERMKANSSMLLGLDILKKMFDDSFPPVVFARNAGLILTDSIDPIKKFFRDQALGVSVDVSKIGIN